MVDLTIEILSGVVLDFDLPNTFCSEDNLFTFPTDDLNGVSGNWTYPTLDLISVSGEQTNTFSTDNIGCVSTFEYIFEVQTELSISFDQPDSICRIDNPIMLSNTSIEGYEGTWDNNIIDPSLIPSDMFTSTWSPNSGQSPCLFENTLTVQIVESQIPEFDLPGELCSTDTVYFFPIIDNQSINGTWSISSIDPSSMTGMVQSIFTPEDCAEVYVWEVEIIAPIIPEFNIQTVLCSLDEEYTFPTISENGIEGAWSMPMIDPSTSTGETTVEFAASSSAFCVNNLEIVIEVIEAQDPIFDVGQLLCWDDDNLQLPINSLNAIEGTWEPAIIETNANQGSTINSTFTPSDGSCTNNAMYSFEVLAPYDVETTVTDPSDCVLENGSIDIEATQGTNLEYSIDGGLTWQSSTSFTDLSSGGYEILIRSSDFEACVYSIDAFLNSTDGPVINEITSADITNCIVDNGQIIVDADGTNLEYSIDGGLTWQASNAFNDLPPNSYIISIREGMSDCIIEAVADIIDFPNTEIVTVNAQNNSDCNVEDGQIEIIAEGEDLEYSIDNGITWTTANVFDNLPDGVYPILVQSMEGIECSAMDQIELFAPDMPAIVDVLSISPSQCSPSTGRIEFEAIGNNLEYSIDGGLTWQTSNIFSGLMSDDYHLVIRDSERINCIEEQYLTISNDLESLNESTISIASPSECDTQDGSIQITNSTPGLEYSIDGGITWQVENTFNNLSSGAYPLIVRVIETPDCLEEQAIEIPNSECPCNELSLGFDVINISCYEEGLARVELISIQGAEMLMLNIQWQNGAQGETNDGVGEGWQVVTIAYDENCIWKDSIYIDRLLPIQFEWIAQDLNCPEGNDGSLQVINTEGGSGNYFYSIDGVDYQSESTFSDLPEGNYQIYVRDDTDCLSIQDLEIQSQPNLEILLPEIETIKTGESVTLNPGINQTQIDSFKWTSLDGFLDSSNLNLLISPIITTTYALEIFYGNCKKYQEIIIDVLEEEDIHIGNIFSPNGDNLNDIIFIKGKPNSTIELNQFSIFDRWGNMMHDVKFPKFNSESTGWDGYYNGQLVNPGVYVYVINYTQEGEPEVKFGAVTLVN